MKLLVTDCHTVMAHLLASCNIVLFSLLEDDKITVHCHVPECHVTHRVSGILYSRSSQNFNSDLPYLDKDSTDYVINLGH